VFVTVAVVWIAFAAAGALVMRRRGHDLFAWSLLFVFLGPLALPLAVSAERHPPPAPPASRHEGALDVLVGHDGSTQATLALETVVKVLGRGITSLTVATVVDAEAADTVRGHETIDEAESRLTAIATDVIAAIAAPVDTVVLPGQPAQCLERYAIENGYDLIVIGSSVRRFPLAGASVARHLAHGSGVPVLIGPAGA
jgi:nucleotide-binding universal stress UspA family protein